MAVEYCCKDCGAIFFQPIEKTWYENHGEGLIERWIALTCPCCGSDEVERYYDDEDDDDA